MSTDDQDGASEAPGRREGRNTTFSSPAYSDQYGQEEGELDPVYPSDLLVDESEDPERTGAKMGNIDGFHQPTAMYDKGQFLGELAELVDGSPDTRAAVEAEVAPPKGCRLIIVAGPDLGVEWAFKVPEITMGRDEDCELTLSDIAVSRKHARISLEGNRFFLEDLGSGNGTHLNGVRVDKEELCAGDEIIIGERTLRFVELNEAPDTAAAHPILGEQAPVPVVGDVPEESGNFEVLGGASQVNASVAQVPAEPSLGDAKVTPVPPKKGSALKKTTWIVGAVVTILILSIGGLVAYKQYQGMKQAEADLSESKTRFLQGIVLVKSQRFGDALRLFERVLSLHPEHSRAGAYIEHCKKELVQWRHIEQASALAKEGRYTEAIEVLSRVDSDSAYAEEAARRIRNYQRTIAERLVEDARRRLDADDVDGALALLAKALERDPGLHEARWLIDEIEARRAGQKKVVIKKKKRTIPPVLTRAVALYRNAQIGPAIDAAEAAGSPDAAIYVTRMKEVKKLLQEASVAHRRKAAAELMRVVPRALSLDDQIAFGKGKVKQRLNRYYADGLYLKGIESLQDKNDVRAFKLLSQALKIQPSHKLAETRLAELQGKARDLYYEGYVLKDSDKAQARKIFTRLVQMTRPSNQYHKMAKKWLSGNK